MPVPSIDVKFTCSFGWKLSAKFQIIANPGSSKPCWYVETFAKLYEPSSKVKSNNKLVLSLISQELKLCEVELNPMAVKLEV